MMQWISAIAWLALAGLLYLVVNVIVRRVADEAQAALSAA